MKASNIELEIRTKVACYLANEISLEEFFEWFVPIIWNIEKFQDKEALDLAYEIQLRLAEFSKGHWSEEELKSKLSQLLLRYNIAVESQSAKTFPLTQTSSKPVLIASWFFVSSQKPHAYRPLAEAPA